MLRREGWPAVACVQQQSCSVCKKFQKYRRTRKRGRGSKIFRTWSTASEYSMKRCPIPWQCTGLNINISITDLVFFNNIHAKKPNKVNCFVFSGGLGFLLWETAVWPRDRDLSYSWNFLGSFYYALKFKRPFALGSFSLPHPQPKQSVIQRKSLLRSEGK